MTYRLAISLIGSAWVFPTSIGAQGFGEYGRAVGSVPHGQGITGSRSSGGSIPGGSSVGGVVDIRGRRLPTRLIVAGKDTRLYPRQDEESEKVAQLAQVESLTPMVQSAGGSEWYMVKTQKGVIGWIKYTEVREEVVKK